MAYLTAPFAARRGADIALTDEEGSCTWQAFDARVNQLIRALRAAGLQPGERLVLFAGNHRAVFELMAAAHHAGLSYVPVNWHFTADELAHVLTDSGAAALFTDSTLAATAEEALRRAEATSAAQALGQRLRLHLCAQLSDAPTSAAAPAPFIDYEAFIASQPDASEPEGQAVGGPMFYTSGTTGRPKGVLKVHPGGPPPALESLRATMEGAMAMLQLPREDGSTTLLAGPYYHSAQWSFSFMPLMAGARLVMTRRFDAAQTLDLIDTYRITQVHLVPTQFIRLLRLPPEVKRTFSGQSLVRVWHGAAPCPPESKRAMIEWWGPCIHEYYGSTEGAVVTGISSAEWLQRPGSVGRAINQSDIHILRDDDGSAAPIGEPGTIYLHHRRGVALRYHNDPAKTEAAHRGAGLFTTGDVGWLDAEGYLFLTDRKIDMIISGGVNIYPAEIEAVLATHPLVQDVAVIGVPDAEFGERVLAIVQLLPEAEARLKGEGDASRGESSADAALRQSLEQHCRATLAGYKVPRAFEFRTDFPRTETGKLQKRLLREPYWVASGRTI